MALSPAFPGAARDYRFLLDRGYPVNASLKLVGDRHRLNAEERTTLFRGVLGSAQSALVRAKLLTSPAGAARVALDGYNILFTVMNYLRGHGLFLATDGLLRDSGGARGRVANEALLERTLGLVADRLAAHGAALALVYFDAPIPFSSRHAAACRAAFEAAGLAAEVILAPSADPLVANFEGDAAVSADSVVAFRSRSPIFDLARDVLERACGASFPDIGVLLAPEGPEA